MGPMFVPGGGLPIVWGVVIQEIETSLKAKMIDLEVDSSGRSIRLKLISPSRMHI